MSTILKCTAPKKGHSSNSARRSCPVHGNKIGKKAVKHRTINLEESSVIGDLNMSVENANCVYQNYKTVLHGISKDSRSPDRRQLARETVAKNLHVKHYDIKNVVKLFDAVNNNFPVSHLSDEHVDAMREYYRLKEEVEKNPGICDCTVKDEYPESGFSSNKKSIF